MLSIIIINFHSFTLLKDCLHSIYSDSGREAFEIMVVDNSPEDGAREQIAMPIS